MVRKSSSQPIPIEELFDWSFNVSGHKFKDLSLLQEALTHPSISNSVGPSYERLEFLGDSVLGVIVAEMLYSEFPHDSEGDLTKKRTALVCGTRVVEIASSIALGDMVFMSCGESASGGNKNHRNLENALEAFIGALYVDGGLEAARNFIVRHWSVQDLPAIPPQDPKTALQEWAQGRNMAIPSYRLINKSGTEHCPIFTVEVSLTSSGTAVGEGNSKKAAEKAAAAALLKKISVLGNENE